MKSVLDVEQISTSLDKMKLYKNQEDVDFDMLKNNLDKINYNYKTNNTTKLDDLRNTLINKLDIITRMHNDNLEVFNKNIKKYKDTSVKVDNILESIR